MAKRLTDTTIWKKQRWFKKLSPLYKLAWKYITDTCDHAGVLKIDFSEFTDDLGVDEFDINDFIRSCNVDFDKKNGVKIKRERIKLLNDCTVWITGFIKFQYEGKDLKVNPSVPAIYSALTVLNSYGTLNEGLVKGYFTLSKPYMKGMLRTKDKDKDIDKDIDKDKDIINNEIKEENNFSKILNLKFNEAENLFKITEPEFLNWKKFIDFVYKNKLDEIFKFKIINPKDFSKLNFPESRWDETVRAILSTGIKEEHNMFFRIPEFLKIIEKRKNGNNAINGSNQPKKLGTSAARIEALRNW